MAEEKIFLDETFPIVKYNNTAPLAGLPLLKRRENAQVADVRVIVTDKRIVVDEKMTVLANIAAVSVGDDEKEVAEHNKERLKPAGKNGLQWLLLVVLGPFCVMFTLAELGDGKAGMAIMGMAFLAGVVAFWRKDFTDAPPPALTPDYAVVIESAGTRDNALVSKDRMAVQKIVRAISDALVSRA